MRCSTPLLLAAIVGFCASPVDGQSPARRSALWISGGADLGYATTECRLCNDEAAAGPAGWVQLGGSPSQKVLIAVEFSYWRADGATTAQEYVLGMAVVRFYPFQNMPLFLTGGMGVGRYAEEGVSSTGNAWALSAHGFAYQAGAGYEFQLSDRFHLGPMVRFVSAQGHKATVNQLGELQDMTGRWFRVGLQITWR